MRARQLEIFCMLMRSGTVTGAAAMLNISQPALSQLLLQTEDQLGFKLFSRVHGRLIPTSEALDLYPEATRIFDELTALRRRVLDMKQGRAGLVRIGASTPPAMTLVPHALAAFRSKYPDVIVRSQIAPMKTIVDMLRDGDISLGVVMNNQPHHGIDVETLGEVRLVCLLPKGHALAEREDIGIEDIGNDQLISYRPGVLPGILLSSLATAKKMAYAPTIEIDMSINALPFVQSHMGIAIVDGLLPWHLFPDIILRPLRPATSVPLAILTNSERPLTGVSEIMRDKLRAAWTHIETEPIYSSKGG
jgi:DNA-binding transcriptional LysR family regulator